MISNIPRDDKTKAPIKELPNVDIKSMLANYASNVLYNSIKFNYDDSNTNQREFIAALYKTDLLKLLKSAEEALSKDGWGYIYWDIWEKNMWGDKVKSVELQFLPWYRVAPSWYETKEIFAATLYRNVAIGNNGTQPIYVQQVLVQGQVTTLNSTNFQANNKIFLQGGVEIEAPFFFNRYVIGDRRVNYRDINIEPLFNKNFNFYSGNFSSNQVEMLNGESIETLTFFHLNDTHNVSYFEKEINNYLAYLNKERYRNATRWVIAGASMQQNARSNNLLSFLAKNNPQEFYLLQRSAKSAREYETNLNALSAKYNIPLTNNSFMDAEYVQLSGDKNSIFVDKIQSTYKANELLEGYEKYVKLYFEGSGYNFNPALTEGSYNNVTAVQSNDKLTIQTARAKQALRETALNSMFRKIYGAWVNYNEHELEEFDKHFQFTIICNAINDQYKNPNVVIAAVQNNIKSIYQAIKDLNPTWTDKQIEEEMQRIMSEKVIMQKMSFDIENEFANSNEDEPQVSAEQNNIGDNPAKSKEGAIE